MPAVAVDRFDFEIYLPKDARVLTREGTASPTPPHARLVRARFMTGRLELPLH